MATPEKPEAETVNPRAMVMRLINECRDKGFSPADAFDIFVAGTVSLAIAKSDMTREWFQAIVLEAFDRASVVRQKRAKEFS